MTLDEAIKMLKSKLDGHTDTSWEWTETVRMAINALEQEPSISEDGTLMVNVEDGNKVNRVLVCGDNHFGGLYYQEQEKINHNSTENNDNDLVSRKAVIDMMNKIFFDNDFAGFRIEYGSQGAMYYAINYVKELPSYSTIEAEREE